MASTVWSHTTNGHVIQHSRSWRKESIVCDLAGLARSHCTRGHGASQLRINRHGIARLLKPYGVEPKAFRVGGVTVRGYVLHDLQDAFKRYLPADPGAKPTA